MREFAPVYCNTVSLIMGGTVLVEVTEKFKDVGTTDYGLVWDTDLVETLGLENYINLAGHERYSAMTLAECLPGSSETAGIPADVGVLIVVCSIVANSAPRHWGHCWIYDCSQIGGSR